MCITRIETGFSNKFCLIGFFETSSYIAQADLEVTSYPVKDALERIILALPPKCQDSQYKPPHPAE